MRKSLVLVLVCIVAVSSIGATPRTRRHRAAKRRSSAPTAAAEKSAAEIKAGRERIAEQIKTLTHFVYLLGGVEKGIEFTAPGAANRDTSPVALELNERTKTRVTESIRSVREGLEKLETDFRANPSFMHYYPYLTGITDIGEAAVNQAAANRFDQAARSLLRAIDQLTDALAAMR